MNHNEKRKPAFEKLPLFCFASLPTTGELIRIDRGELGYCPCYVEDAPVKADDDLLEKLNGELGVSKWQREAMLIGSMRGWDVPGADPDVLEQAFKDAARRSKARWGK